MTAAPKMISIDLDDVAKSGGVEQALHAYCETSDCVSSGVVGPAFVTSGPGSGWTITHDASDYAERAMEEGALYYLDATDGRIAYAPTCETELYQGQRIEWTDGSMVRVKCPCIEDAMDHPAMVAEMAQAVIDAHGPLSDRQEWAALVRQIQAAGEAVSDIDADDLLEGE